MSFKKLASEIGGLEEKMKQKHLLRWTSSVVGISLIILGIVDGRLDVLPYLGAEWLLVGGILLIALGARKGPSSVGR